MIKRLWVHRQLVLTLTRRQFDLRYRQSMVGLAWALLPPLVSLAAATLVFHKVVGVDTGSTPYALFAMAALAPWAFFASSVSLGIPVVQQTQQLISRLAFPRAALPLSMVGISLIDLGVASLIFVIFVFALGAGLPLTALWFPVILVIELFLIVGIVLWGSALNVFARDVRLAVPLLVQFWLFVTPVMYPLNSVPQSLRIWYLINPMTAIVETTRQVLVYGHSPEMGLLLTGLGTSVTVLAIGIWYFSSTESRFADVV